MAEVDYADASYVKASHFLAGRSGSAVEIVVVHTTEQDCAPTVARHVASFFAGPGVTTSAHYIVGPDEVVQCVREQDMAWHAQGVNPLSIGIEHTGRASFSSVEWSTERAQQMLRRSARLVADICKRYGLPATFVDHAGLLARRKGITTHAEVTQAFHKTDHGDPGPHFPLSAWMAMVEEEMGPASAPASQASAEEAPVSDGLTPHIIPRGPTPSSDRGDPTA